MRPMFFAMCLLSLSFGCGRPPKTIVEEKAKAEKGEQAVKVHILGLSQGDWDQSWMSWKLACGDREFTGTKIGVEVISLPKESIGQKECALLATGSVPYDLTDKYITDDGIYYAATIPVVKAGEQSVSAKKTYTSKSTNNDSKVEDLIATTNAGGKCAEFDIETFQCK